MSKISPTQFSQWISLTALWSIISLYVFRVSFFTPYILSEVYSYRASADKLQSMGQFRPITCFCKEVLIGTQPYSSDYLLSMAVFAQQLQSWIIATEILQPEKPTIYTICPFAGKNGCQPWPRTVVLKLSSVHTLKNIWGYQSAFVCMGYAYSYLHIRNQIWKQY